MNLQHVRDNINVDLSCLYIWFWCLYAPAVEGFKQTFTNATKHLHVISCYVLRVGDWDFK